MFSKRRVVPNPYHRATTTLMFNDADINIVLGIRDDTARPTDWTD
jgi:hypothetical protein